ncbi:60S ribosomal export protein NMD3-like, partial [Centruroides sculpturatus]|uniref:60S ribosomal export protein NMD3-like n=1 Tax=Centruroides sculpturatus TaxID=218467 RepID=UPI000C6DD535
FSLCCQCGISILPNPANMCVGCIRTKVDITEGIPKQVVLYFCNSCERYLQPPSHWIQCNLESRELLTLCLKKLKGLNKVIILETGIIMINFKLQLYNPQILGGKYLFANDVVCLSPQLANLLGSIGQLCICTRVTNSIHLIDPSTLQIAEVNSQLFWRYPFSSLCSSKQLIEYTVMNNEFIKDSERSIFAGQGKLSERHVLSDVWVVRSSELGLTNDLIHSRTHMGHLLKPGDTVLGYDIRNSNVNNVNFDKLRKDRVPDVVLVKKVYCNQSSRHRKRKWKLKHLSSDMDLDSQSDNKDYTEFLEDLEEDPLYRQNVNIYVDPRKKTASMPIELDEDLPQISLQEMLDDLSLVTDDDKMTE